MKGKPKFRVGQVVCVRKNYQREDQYGIVCDGPQENKEGDYEYFIMPGGWQAVEFALRPLTARERGPERKS